MKLVAWFLWIYNLFLGIILTGHPMPGRRMCKYSSGRWGWPKCRGRQWQHCLPLCRPWSEFLHGSKAAFTQCQHWGKKQGMAHLTSFVKYKLLFFISSVLLIICILNTVPQALLLWKPCQGNLFYMFKFSLEKCNVAQYKLFLLFYRMALHHSYLLSLKTNSKWWNF